jgi:hypothetical protein
MTNRRQLTLINQWGRPVHTTKTELTDEMVGAVLCAIGATRWSNSTFGRIHGCTPDQARQLLELRPAYQRSVSKKHVARLQAAMTEGRFLENGSALCFSREVDLVDGQHRLTAQVQAGVTLDWTVCIVGDDAFSTIDSGNKSRSLAQIAKIKSSGKTALHAGVIAGLVYDHVGFGENAYARLGNQAKVDIALAHPFRDVIAALHRRSVKGMQPRAGLMAGMVACLRVDRDAALEFFTHVVDNSHVIGGQECTAVKALCSVMITGMRGPELGRMVAGLDEAARAIHAYNAFVEGRPLSLLRGASNGKLPAPRARSELAAVYHRTGEPR